MTWKFDQNVAQNFVQHARQHIPNYDQVIDKCVDLCEHLLTSHSKIIDVGCATGETICRLHAKGFTNLVGVDASKDMLDQCNTKLASFYLSDSLPMDQYDAVLCNWTLHFVQNKQAYLKDIYDCLSPTGFAVITEKTSLDPLLIKFYHRFKSSQGVSQQDIQQKEKSVRDIMFIDGPEWYFDQFKNLGFSQFDIIDADYCFTTFLVRK